MKIRLELALQKRLKACTKVAYVVVGALGMAAVMGFAVLVPSALVMTLANALSVAKPYVVKLLTSAQVSDFGIGVASFFAFFSAAVLSVVLFQKAVYLVRKWISEK